MLNRFLVALFSFTLLALPAAAFDTPKALVEAIYKPYAENTAPAPIEAYYSEALRQLSAAKLAREGNDGEGLGFDPFINAQDFLLLNLQIGEPVVIGDRALINVRFHNFDHPTALTLALIEESDGWKVDDIASMGIEHHWLLSWLLAFDPFAVN